MAFPRLPAVLALLLAVCVADVVRANPASAALRAKGYDLTYNLDYDEALAVLKQAVEADPNDAAALRGAALTAWLRILFLRGSATVDDYLGRAKPRIHMPPTPPELMGMFRDYIARSLAAAEQQVAASPQSAEGHYQVGLSVGLEASFTASVEGRALSGFRAARRAFDEHEQALELDPRRKDAGLIVGTYRYVISTLPLALRMMAYVTGFGGGRERGIAQIEQAAAYPSEGQVDALLGLVIVYNREGRYDDALRVLAELKRTYPRNRLLWLTAGGTALRAGHLTDAMRELDEGNAKLAVDSRPRMFGEEALWHYYRGAVLVSLRRLDPADRELRAGLEEEAREWVRGRLNLELGKLADLKRNRADAQTRYRTASTFFERDNDTIGLAESSRLLRVAYR